MSGNGVDLGVVLGAVDIVARNVNALASGLHDLQTKVIDLSGEVRGLSAQVGSLQNELRSEMREVRRELAQKADKEDVALLRQTVTEYHAAVIGHGVLISDLDDRLRRVEQHLGLTSAG